MSGNARANALLEIGRLRRLAVTLRSGAEASREEAAMQDNDAERAERSASRLEELLQEPGDATP